MEFLRELERVCEEKIVIRDDIDEEDDELLTKT